MTPDEYRRFRAERQEAGTRLDPETADCFVRHVYEMEPYGVIDDLPPELCCINRVLFAASHDLGIVAEADLPSEVIETLRKRSRNSRSDVNPVVIDVSQDDDEIPF